MQSNEVTTILAALAAFVVLSSAGSAQSEAGSAACPDFKSNWTFDTAG